MGATVSSVLFGGGAAAASTSTSASASSSSEPSSVTTFHSSERWQLHYNACKESSKLLVIDFSALWCEPCKFIEPAFNEMAAKYTDTSFVKIDVDELPDVAKEFGVQAMPTFVLVKGEEVDRVVGAKKDELDRKVQKHRSSS